VDNTRDYARVSHRQWSNYNIVTYVHCSDAGESSLLCAEAAFNISELSQF